MFEARRQICRSERIARTYPIVNARIINTGRSNGRRLRPRGDKSHAAARGAGLDSVPSGPGRPSPMHVVLRHRLPTCAGAILLLLALVFPAALRGESRDESWVAAWATSVQPPVSGMTGP